MSVASNNELRISKSQKDIDIVFLSKFCSYFVYLLYIIDATLIIYAWIPTIYSSNVILLHHYIYICMVVTNQ
jgi:hypothetical protein